MIILFIWSGISHRSEKVYLPVLHHPDKTSFDINLHHLLNSKIQIKNAVVTQEDVSMKASDWGLG
ncbi:hypothetical protein [Psychromonas sp.]|uniref:hypothetical protein n=1 Tax=Psychromonas sp. TaxID=1884585 RepID=UPI00356172D6